MDEKQLQPEEHHEEEHVAAQPTEEQATGYVHVDEFLSQKPELSEEDKEGFRVFMRLKEMTYHFSLKHFEEELKNFFNRKR